MRTAYFLFAYSWFDNNIYVYELFAWYMSRILWTISFKQHFCLYNSYLISNAHIKSIFFNHYNDSSFKFCFSSLYLMFTLLKTLIKSNSSSWCTVIPYRLKHTYVYFVFLKRREPTPIHILLTWKFGFKR